MSSIPILDTVLSSTLDRIDNLGDDKQGTGCLLAAGFDPASSDTDNLLATMSRPDALMKCLGQQPESYRGLIATFVLLAVAGLVYWLLPTVRDRQRRLVPVSEVDADGTLAAELDALRERTGIRSDLRFRVDSARMTSGASVYGRTGSYTVCLHAGLLARRGTDSEGFRAVVLHELAHVHHRDVDYAYAGTALWRVFVLLALLPDFVWVGRVFFLALSGTDSPWWPGAVPELLAFIFAGLLLAGLVHLARADLLRRREFQADRQAVEWGAHPANWNRPDPSGAVAPLLHRLTALLRTHPGWAERRRALSDAGHLLGVSRLEMFLTGVSASLLYGSLGTLPLLSWSPALWLTVALAAPVVCIALGLPIVRTVRTADGPTGSGALAGVWLGCGLLVGEFVSSGRYRFDWLLPKPQYLLAFLFIAAVPAVWWSQTLRLALGLPKRGQRRAAAVLCALVTAAMLWGGLLWWHLGGERIALGAGDMGGALAKSYATSVPGNWQDYSLDLSTLSVGMPMLTTLYNESLVSVTTLLMWLVPMVLLLLQRAGAGLRARRTLGAGLAGGLASWAGLALASYVMYAQRPVTFKERVGPFLIVHVWWVIVTVMAACLLTAALVAAFSRRHWLLRALIAAQVVQLMAYGGVFLLFSADGCLGPLNTAFDVCQGHPRQALAVDRAVTVLTLTNAVIGAGCAALVGAGLAWAVRRLRGQPASDVPAVLAQTVPVRRRLVLLKAGTVLVLGVPALVLTAVTSTQASSSPVVAQPRQEHSEPDRTGPGRSEPGRTPSATKAPKIRTWQTWSWLNQGGALHEQQILAASMELNAAILKTKAQKPKRNGKVSVDDKTFNRACGTLRKRVEEAQDYFPVPDHDLQKTWSDALSRMHHGASGCQEAMFPPKGEPHKTKGERERLFITSLNEIAEGMPDLGSAIKDIKKAATSRTK
ncbi:M48 family metallopeptidase [Streptomyces sp. NPDC002004]